MNARDFITAIKTSVHRSAANGVIKGLEKPPGRKPDPTLVKLSQWFEALPRSDQENVRVLIERATDLATYNFLAVLDGLAAIEPVGPKGKLELFHQKGNTRVLLNDPNSEELTSLFKA